MTTFDDYDEEATRNLTRLDRHNLEVEVSHIATMVYDYGVFLAYADDKMRKAKLLRDRKRGEIANLIRNDPAEYGITRISENAIIEVMRNNEEVTEAEDNYLDALLVFNKLKAAQDALGTKRFSLSWALKLWTQNYYADLPVDEKRKAAMIESDHYADVYEELAREAKLRRENEN